MPAGQGKEALVEIDPDMMGYMPSLPAIERQRERDQSWQEQDRRIGQYESDTPPVGWTPPASNPDRPKIGEYGEITISMTYVWR